MVNDSSRYNAQNTFDELLRLGAIPIVNENDTVSTSEIPYVDSFGDNDRLLLSLQSYRSGSSDPAF